MNKNILTFFNKFLIKLSSPINISCWWTWQISLENQELRILTIYLILIETKLL